jgi:hypothetical protein
MKRYLLFLLLLPFVVFGQKPFHSPHYTAGFIDTVVLKSHDSIWKLNIKHDSIFLNGSAYSLLVGVPDTTGWNIVNKTYLSWWVGLQGFIKGTGTTSQYIRGDGSLATFPSIPAATDTSLLKHKNDTTDKRGFLTINAGQRTYEPKITGSDSIHFWDGLKGWVVPNYNFLRNKPTIPVEQIPDGWIYDTLNPVGNIHGVESSIIVENDTAWMWYRQVVPDLSKLYLTYATNTTFSNWSIPIQLTGAASVGSFPYVFKVGSFYFMAVITSRSPDIYLLASINKVNWTYRNGGNPILTHSGTTSSLIYHLWNPAIAVNGTTWHLIQEASSSTSAFHLMYSYVTSADTSNMNFNTNLSSNLIIDHAGNADLKYISSHNALLLLYGDNSSGYWLINGKYASLSDNLTLAASWKTPANFPRIYNNQIHVSDPFMVDTPTKKYKSLMSFNYNQGIPSGGNWLYQAYLNKTIQQLYESLIDTLNLNGGINTSKQITGGQLLINGNSALYGDLSLNGNLISNNGKLYASGEMKLVTSSNNTFGKLIIYPGVNTTLGSQIGLHIGDDGNTGGLNDLYQIGFGYSGSKIPSSVVGAVVSDAGGDTKTDIVFGTRNSTSNIAPTERMRIKANGTTYIEDTCQIGIIPTLGSTPTYNLVTDASSGNVYKYAWSTGTTYQPGYGLGLTAGTFSVTLTDKWTDTGTELTPSTGGRGVKAQKFTALDSISMGLNGKIKFGGAPGNVYITQDSYQVRAEPAFQTSGIADLGSCDVTSILTVYSGLCELDNLPKVSGVADSCVWWDKTDNYLKMKKLPVSTGGTVTSVGVLSPLVANPSPITSSGTISMPAATGSNDGYMTETQVNTLSTASGNATTAFNWVDNATSNHLLSAGTFTVTVTGGGTLSGTNTGDNATNSQYSPLVTATSPNYIWGNTGTGSAVASFVNASGLTVGNLSASTYSAGSYAVTIPETGTVVMTQDTMTNAKKLLNPTLPNSSVSSNSFIYFIANETQALGDVVFINSSGKAQIAKSDAIANTSPYLFMAARAEVSGATGCYMLVGTVRYDSWAGWTVGGTIYLTTTGTTGNTLTQAAPSGANNVIQSIGVAIASKIILFNGTTTPIEHQ